VLAVGKREQATAYRNSETALAHYLFRVKQIEPDASAGAAAFWFQVLLAYDFLNCRLLLISTALGDRVQ
jgi:hypothetical protein